jgi:mannose-6-phosphate isomerase
MFVGLTNTPVDSAWGSTTAIAELLHRVPSGRPEAEYWLGSHASSPTRIVDGPDAGKTLDQLVALPFIMKVLAAETSLSLQAHPSSAQAAAGFARENALGIPIDAQNRNYRDGLHKPEMIYAVSDQFEALCGFRPVAETRALLAKLGPDPLVASLIERLVDDSSLRAVFEWLIGGGEDVAKLRARILELAAAQSAASVASAASAASVLEFRSVENLSRLFPEDVGILLSLLLNYVTLRAGEAVYLPAGNIHAYQHGLGIEVLAASDNVLRGGLTPKHIDVPELLSVLDFRPLPVPYLAAEQLSHRVRAFRPDVPDFELIVIQPAGGEASFDPQNDSIVLATVGELRVDGVSGSRSLAPGDAVYVSRDEGRLTVTGSGTAFLATAQG